jgi:hypothetical protein
MDNPEGWPVAFVSRSSMESQCLPLLDDSMTHHIQVMLG